MVSSRNTLSRGGAVAMAAALAAMGLAIIFMAVGMLPGAEASPEAPPWVGVCAGGVFVLCAAALVIGFAVAGGLGPSGDLPSGTPFALRLAQYLIGLSIVASMAAIASWVAFGPGPRTFTSSGTISSASSVSPIMGRVAFGIGALLCWLCLVAFGVAGLRRLRSPR
jgi:hypothetical protein